MQLTQSKQSQTANITCYIESSHGVFCFCESKSPTTKRFLQMAHCSSPAGSLLTLPSSAWSKTSSPKSSCICNHILSRLFTFLDCSLFSVGFSGLPPLSLHHIPFANNTRCLSSLSRGEVKVAVGAAGRGTPFPHSL